MMLCATLVVLAVILALADAGRAAPTTWSVVMGGSGPELVRGAAADAVATGAFDGDVRGTGFATLDVNASAAVPAWEAAFAAGFLEGAVTAGMIADVWAGELYDVFGNTTVTALPPAVTAFIEQHLKWINAQVAARTDDPFWVHTGLAIKQWLGLYDGYMSHRAADAPSLTVAEAWLLNSPVDVDDIVAAVDAGERARRELLPRFGRDAAALVARLVARRGRCSAVVRCTTAECFMSHTTWSSFSTMLRINKRYTLPFAGVAAASVSMSSYPGSIVSTDDWYVTSAGLVVTETSYEMLNTTLYDEIVPESVFYWSRVVVANRLAASGKEWTRLFSTAQSGTYCNTWLVLDRKTWHAGRARRGTALPAGTLWLWEGLPGIVSTEDVSGALLADGTYLASYNIPRQPEIFAASGYAQYAEKYGDAFSYEHCPRARIFARDAPDAADAAAVQALIRSNKWRTDPFSKGDPGLAICSRYDLEADAEKRDAFGCIDAKLATASADAADLGFTAIGGPTHEDADTATFTWDDPQWRDVPHAGQPTTWAYDWFAVRW